MGELAVRLRAPGEGDQAAFLAAVRRSRELHAPWVAPPDTPTAFGLYLERLRRDSQRGFLAELPSGALVGVVNVSEIVRGAFQSGYLGYYAFAPHAGCGLMTQALSLVLLEAFGRMGLHRLEANIQPGNDASRALVSRLGFQLEGFSPKYLKIAGDWRDHERWAIRADNWVPTLRPRTG